MKKSIAKITLVIVLMSVGKITWASSLKKMNLSTEEKTRIINNVVSSFSLGKYDSFIEMLTPETTFTIKSNSLKIDYKAGTFISFMKNELGEVQQNCTTKVYFTDKSETSATLKVVVKYPTHTQHVYIELCRDTISNEIQIKEVQKIF